MKRSALSAALFASASSHYTLFNNTRCWNDVGQIDNLPSVAACESACDAASHCQLFSYCPSLNVGGCPVAGGCWFYPISALPGCTQAESWTSGSQEAPPPPVPTPAAWVPKIAACDMLYTSSDADVNRNSMPMIGNGFIATQVSTDSMYVAGLFNGYLTVDPSHRARIPSTAAVAAPGTPGPSALDVREATYFRRSYIDPSAPGACTSASNVSCSNAATRVWVEQRFYAHRAIPSLLVMEVQVLPPDADEGLPPRRPSSHSASPRPASPQDAPYAVLILTNSPGSATKDVNFSTVPTPDAPFTIINGSTIVSETNSSGLFGVSVLTSILPQQLVIPVAGPFETHAFITVVRTTIETAADDLIDAVQTDYSTAVALAANGTLHSSHVAEWAATIWPSGFGTDRADVARAVNTSLYAILSSVRGDRVFGLSPGGITAGYSGHSFWDTDFWMFPGVLLTHPDVAASLLEYRFNRLDGARDKAKSYSPPFGGAMFPWESAFTGEEVCPSWAPTGLREIHINGDIAIAAFNFYRSTLDDTYLNETAWPLLAGISDFWMSKLAIDNAGAPAGSPLSLLNVIPPDEYADHKNNSAFTNYGAIMTLTYAARVAELLGVNPSVYAPWLDAASRIVIPFNTSDGGWHPEFDGYEMGTQIKQADVILLGFPLDSKLPSVTPASRANDLAIYAKVTDDGGPAMTWGMFAVGYIELGAGFEALAASNFNRSFANAQPPFDVWTETPNGGTPNFLTGAGGFLQAAFQGYTGLRVNDSALSLTPALPEITTITQLRGISYLGARIDISYDADLLNVTVQAESSISETRALLKPTRVYSLMGLGTALPRVDALASAPSLEPLTARSQFGRVVLGDGRVVAAHALQLIDADNVKHALAPGATVTIATQAVSIVKLA